MDRQSVNEIRGAMSRSKSSRQGQLDGLCGPYAITNALAYLGHGGDRADVFQTACSAVSRNRWAILLWEGTTFGDLKKMISACMANARWITPGHAYLNSISFRGPEFDPVAYLV